jgi:hypothetical protein
MFTEDNVPEPALGATVSAAVSALVYALKSNLTIRKN